ncbi:30733_t:CDS:1, partial [Racocetra persica]
MLYKVTDISYEHVYKSLNQQKEYITANGFSKKVIQMGLDAEPLAIQELNTLMKSFIAKHMPKYNQEATCKNFKRILLAKSQN